MSLAIANRMYYVSSSVTLVNLGYAFLRVGNFNYFIMVIGTRYCIRA